VAERGLDRARQGPGQDLSDQGGVWPAVVWAACALKEGFGPLSFGRLALLATIPIGLGLYLSLRLPWAIKRYRLTNRRVAVEVGINPRVMQFVSLEGFDSIEVDVSQGQEWYACGDLVFRRGAIETLRLMGVSRPESFRRVCLEAHDAYVSVAKLQPEPVGA